MEYLDQNKIKEFQKAMQDKEAARKASREKTLPSPAEIREEARKKREAQKQGSPWMGLK